MAQGILFQNTQLVTLPLRSLYNSRHCFRLPTSQKTHRNCTQKNCIRGKHEEEGWREECGVVGIYGDEEAGKLCFYGLRALQHRGEEGAGIVTCKNNLLNSVTGIGLVSEVFNEEVTKLQGTLAIGHVRYGTTGSSVLENVQPFVASYKYGEMAVAHNGNFVNYKKIRQDLEKKGSVFISSSDTEVVLHLIATSKATSFIARLVEACEQLQGAYSLIFLTNDNKLVAVRDPYGFRPLVMGCTGTGAIVFASETCALDLMDAKFEREVNPGEVIVVDKDGVSSLCLMQHKPRKACSFELVYFSSPSSIVFGLSVDQTRFMCGEILAEEASVECDVVIPVPNSGTVAALGYAKKSGIPFRLGLHKRDYAGRTFIKPNQKMRELGVKLKLSPVHSIVAGKRVVVVDDSIVRGTTCSQIVKLLRDAGAKEVHMRIACPPVVGSCYYGVDTPRKEELISYRLSVEDTCKAIGADSLAFLPLSRLRLLLGNGFCDACYSCDYPFLPSTP